MKNAIPLEKNELSQHFGHCEAFAVFTIEDNSIAAKEIVKPLESGCGSHPQLLTKLGCKVVLAGGIGQGAVSNLQTVGIEVVSGVCAAPLEQIVENYLAGTLASGNELCNHEHHEGSCQGHH